MVHALQRTIARPLAPGGIPTDVTATAHPVSQRHQLSPRRRGAWAAGVALACLGLAACSRTEPAYRPGFSAAPARSAAPEYVLAVHPLHNPRHLFEIYQPLVDHLNARIPGVQLRLEASTDYAGFEQKLARRQVAFALPNPYQTIKAIDQGYHVFAKMGDDAQFRGVVLVRRGSGIHAPGDLKGKTVSFPARTALAATLLSQWYLHEHGVDVDRDITSRYVGSQESAIMNVVIGNADAGSTWTLPWVAFQKEHPDQAARVEMAWQTPSLINNALIVRNDVPTAVVDALQREFTTLGQSPEGQAILARMQLSRFERADNATFAPVADFVRRFERDVHPIEPAK